MSAKIIFRIKRGGAVEMEVDGVVGDRCEQLTKPFEDALAGEVDKHYKPEYYDVEEDQQDTIKVTN